MEGSGRVLGLIPPDSINAFRAAARRLGIECVVTSDVATLLKRLGEARYSATCLSLSVNLMDGPLAMRVGENPNSGTLLLSAPAVSLERALLMERAGAVALLREPLEVDDLLARLSGVIEEGPSVRLPAPTAVAHDRPLLIGDDPAMAEVFETIARVARSTSTVLVLGESGTGKEVVARVLHWASDRSSGPFVAVNCAAIPEHLLESELFGHEKGSFTGAVSRRMGRFERARGGTLFLDEIGDMNLVLQAKILRALQERTIERVGGESTMEVDVRVIAATNQELRSRIDEGSFREDLYYRLAVVEMHLPALRDRVGDVRELALHFTAEFAAQYEKPISAITEAALSRLSAYYWPGNVRELRNVLDRAVLLASDDVIRSRVLRLGAGAPNSSARPASALGGGYPATLSLEQVEADHIARVLAANQGHMGRAADVLGIHRNTLTRKVQDYGLPDAS